MTRHGGNNRKECQQTSANRAGGAYKLLVNRSEPLRRMTSCSLLAHHQLLVYTNTTQTLAHSTWYRLHFTRISGCHDVVSISWDGECALVWGHTQLMPPTKYGGRNKTRPHKEKTQTHLLNFEVPLDINFLPSEIFGCNQAHGFECHTTHEMEISGGKFRTNDAFNYVDHLLLVT